MDVKPLNVCVARYYKGCLRAYLEGKHDLKYVEGVFGTSRDSVARGVAALSEIRTPVVPSRRAEFLQWLTAIQNRTLF